MFLMLSSLFYLYIVLDVVSILGSPTTKDVNNEGLTFSAVAPANPTLEPHLGIVGYNDNADSPIKLTPSVMLSISCLTTIVNDDVFHVFK